MTNHRRRALARALCALFFAVAAAPAAAQDPAPQPPAAQESPFVFSTDGGLKIASRDGNATLQLGGRLQYDYDATRSRDNGVDTRDFDVRRARLDVRGRVGDWGYKIQFNLSESEQAPSGGTAEDLYISYLGFGPKATVTAGKQPEPIGLERIMSSNDIASLERSAMSELYTPARNSGIKLHGAGARWSYAVGVFEAKGDGSNDFGRRALTGRATCVPYLRDDTRIHLGAGFTARQGAGTSPDIHTYVAEAALGRGPLLVHGEYFNSRRDDTTLDGYYVQAAWNFAGDARPYKDGAFGRPQPRGKYGVLELALRHEAGDGNYSDIGLNSSRQIFDGRQTTLGLNWYADRNARIGLSHARGQAHDATGARLRGNELRLRFQYAF